MKKLAAIIIVLTLALPAFSAVKADEVIQKVRAAQQKIKNLETDITSKMTSDIKGSRSIEQKGHLWVKGEDKSKFEISEPQQQIMINAQGKSVIIDKKTGRKIVQDLEKSQGAAPGMGKGSPIDQTKVFDYFDLEVKENKGFFGFGREYVITGIPKEKNEFLGKMVFYIDGRKYVPKKVEVFNPKGAKISMTNLKYRTIDGIYVPQKSVSEISLPNGKMKVVMEFKNIKVNHDIPDSIFKI